MQKERREMSTADLARQAEATDTAVLSERDRDVNPGQGPVAVNPPRTMLFDDQAATDFRTRWTDIQSAFVDSPRSAVERADTLVAETMKRMAESFSAERASLEAQWDRGDDVTTEDLRIALQRYRAFFDRLLNV
jgi:hypothetical protein